MIDSVLFRGVAAPLHEIAVGASRIAGPPDLPSRVDWPLGPDGKRKLPMVLQLALADVAPFGLRLPATGTLWFFGAQLASWESPPAIDRIPGAILYAPAGKLVRQAMPPEASDEEYWDCADVARCVDWRAHRSETEEDEPTDPHVLFPIRKQSTAFGEWPASEWTPLLQMASDYDIRMNWGDAAWATWSVPPGDLPARFDRAIAAVWIG